MITDLDVEERRGLRRAVARRRPGWVWFALALVLGAVAAGIAGLTVAAEKVKYESVAALAVDQPRAIAVSGDAGVVDKLSALRYKYAGLLTTQTFAEPVATQLHATVGQVRGALFATTPGNSLIMNVGARTTSAATSQAVAQTAADALVRYVQNEQTSAGIKPDLQFTMTVVTPADPGQKISPTFKRELGAAGLAGLVVFAAVLAVVAIRTREE